MALLFPMILVACASSMGPRDASHPNEAAPPELWSPTNGCAVAGHAMVSEGTATTSELIKTEEQLAAIVVCNPPRPSAFDFDSAWLAAFRLVSEGGSFRALDLHDDGTTLTLDVESYSYCGGAPPPTFVHTFVFRVPRANPKLETHVTAGKRPPCPPNLP
jgi:hypothetical protein